jgi:hypothetical protein
MRQGAFNPQIDPTKEPARAAGLAAVKAHNVLQDTTPGFWEQSMDPDVRELERIFRR